MKQSEKGFTLIEMLIVLLVISILLIITVPNIVKHQQSIRDKGCSAFVKTVQAQVQAYQIDNDALPSNLQELQEKKYITGTKCPNGSSITLGADGLVSEAKSGSD